MNKTLRDSLVYVGISIAGVTLLSLHNFRGEKARARTSSSSVAQDTSALKRRIQGDYFLLNNYLPRLRSAAAENNPNGLASEVLKPYTDIENEINRRIAARTDSLIMARGGAQ